LITAEPEVDAATLYLRDDWVAECNYLHRKKCILFCSIKANKILCLKSEAAVEVSVKLFWVLIVNFAS